jgi:paraquat-inducible protein A
MTCSLCGQEHQPIPLQAGQKARCRRCNTLLAIGPRVGRDAPLCFALTGLILSVPAVLLPFVGASELGDRRVSLLLTGVGALWDGNMRALAFLVLLCGALIPAILLILLVTLYAPAGLGRRWVSASTLTRVAKILGSWAYPEVQVLAVLVGVVKLGSLVHLELGPGFWSYCGMAVSLLLAQHGFEFVAPPAAAGTPSTPRT